MLRILILKCCIILFSLWIGGIDKSSGILINFKKKMLHVSLLIWPQKFWVWTCVLIKQFNDPVSILISKQTLCKMKSTKLKKRSWIKKATSEVRISNNFFRHIFMRIDLMAWPYGRSIITINNTQPYHYSYKHHSIQGLVYSRK